MAETVYRRRVFERDGWRCQLCGKKTDRNATVPSPNAPVLDHIIPLACGGDHSYVNTQTAHFSCNSLKGSGVLGDAEQLRLIA